MKDNLVICKRCGSNACYQQNLKEATTWLCWTCGFTTSSLMKEGSATVKKAIKSYPELYKELMHVDSNKLCWLPATVSIPNKGIVFIDGTNKKDWKWKAAKMVPITEEDQKVKPDQTHKTDMKNAQTFGKEDFMNACEFIDMFSGGK